MKVRLIVPLTEIECSRRNALRDKPQAFVLREGTVGELVDTFDKGQHYMVEFACEKSGRCQWLGMLRRSEIDFVEEFARAA
jgi:hypothetical protein